MNKRIKELLVPIKNSLCYQFFYKSQVNDNKVFLESRNGIDFASNMIRILLELKKQYSYQYSIVIPYKRGMKKKIESILNRYNINNVKLVKYESISYYKHIYQCKYLFNDVTFPDRFVKKDDQTYLNIWHGTPYKKMGRDSYAGAHVMNNIQRNFFMSDYLLFPNKYCQDIMTSAYSLNGLYTGHVLHEGYPRNTIFFNTESRIKIKKKYGLEEKRVYVYMPTFREKLTDRLQEQQVKQLYKYFDILDKKLEKDEIVFVKLHNYLNAVIDVSKFNHICLFPSDLETYEFLNVADVLITDYSSVMFDFAITKKPVIQFMYDIEDYDLDRGFYKQPIKLPFLIAYTVDELINLLHSELSVKYSDEYIELYSTYENKDATSNILSHVIEGRSSVQEEMIHNNLKKVFLYGGSLDNNKATFNLIRLVTDLQKSENHYYIGFSKAEIKDKIQNLSVLKNIRDVYEVSGTFYNTIGESMALFLFYKLHIATSFVNKRLNKMHEREIKRNFTNMSFDTIVSFVEDEMLMLALLQRLQSKRILYLSKQFKTKDNQFHFTLKHAFKNYDAIIVLSKASELFINEMSGRQDGVYLFENIKDINNLI